MNVVVIGGGAAGMMAAIVAAKEKNNVVLVEKTSSLGNKLKITGKGRCNLTFDGKLENFKENIVKNYKFMYSGFSFFNNEDVVEFFNKLGVKTKVERGGRIFPISDKAEDIVNALVSELNRHNVKIKLNAKVTKIDVKENVVCSVTINGREKINCDKCIIATGGMSYPKTGSTGDGYDFAKDLGHSIVDIRSGLIPFTSSDNMCKRLQGLSLRNVGIQIFENRDDKKISLYTDFGEMMFAHFGVTGPTILSASSKLNQIKDIDLLIEDKKIFIEIDLKPALDFDMLDKRICRDFEKYANKEFKNSLFDLLPKRLIPEIIHLSKIDEDEKVHQITKAKRQNLVKVLKSLTVEIDGFMPLDMAIVTSGGVNVKEVNPKTMESKLIKGLYFAGEVLDIDAYTGGYNLQIAFSTANLAGKNN